MDRRVVITGMGAITPIGNTADAFWQNAKQGVVGIDLITRFDTSNFKVKIAAEVKGFEPERYMERKDTKRMELFSQFAMAAAKQAVDDSGLDVDRVDKGRFGVIVGSGIGALGSIEEQVIKMTDKGPSRVAPLFIPGAIINMAAGNIAIAYGAGGICQAIVTACASGTDAIGTAFRSIKHGYADVIIAGGAEASITGIGIAGFTTLTALAMSNDPLRASIPFDLERKGFVMGEGAGILVLEEKEAAVKRGANILAEIVGYGANCDAYHMTSPMPAGEGASAAMAMAMAQGGLQPTDITYINAHGTGTEANDKTETVAIKRTFGAYADKLPVSSTKSMIGHLLGAAGAVEAVACVKALNDNFAPPTAGYKVHDPDCDLNVVPNVGVKQEMNAVLSNSFGFGGHNAVLCFKKWEGTT